MTPTPPAYPDADVYERIALSGAAAEGPGAPCLVIEVPHGATRTAEYQALEARLKSPLPKDLVDFFHVNTDAGAPELALETARRFVAACPAARALALRCRIPRTFIDCNRRLDATPEQFKAGKVTPGLMPWITHTDDRALLLDLHGRYVARVAAELEAAAPTGGLLLLHTYAPRSVDVAVDADIVRNLRRAYAPNVEPTWPLRPEVDVIHRDLEGKAHAPPRALEALRRHLGGVGITLADGETYPLHPSTLAWDLVHRFAGRTLCVEVRRDLLAAPFSPFSEMAISATQVERLAEPLARAGVALVGG
jgi:hypothetical protein